MFASITVESKAALKAHSLILLYYGQKGDLDSHVHQPRATLAYSNTRLCDVFGAKWP